MPSICEEISFVSQIHKSIPCTFDDCCAESHQIRVASYAPCRCILLIPPPIRNCFVLCAQKSTLRRIASLSDKKYAHGSTLIRSTSSGGIISVDSRSSHIRI